MYISQQHEKSVSQHFFMDNTTPTHISLLLAINVPNCLKQTTVSETTTLRSRMCKKQFKFNRRGQQQKQTNYCQKYLHQTTPNWTQTHLIERKIKKSSIVYKW